MTQLLLCWWEWAGSSRSAEKIGTVLDSTCTTAPCSLHSYSLFQAWHKLLLDSLRHIQEQIPPLASWQPTFLLGEKKKKNMFAMLLYFCLGSKKSFTAWLWCFKNIRKLKSLRIYTAKAPIKEFKTKHCSNSIEKNHKDRKVIQISRVLFHFHSLDHVSKWKRKICLYISPYSALKFLAAASSDTSKFSHDSEERDWWIKISPIPKRDNTVVW